jgi:putative MATE family efflux protein
MAQRKGLVKDFNSGSIPKMLLTFMLPFMASNAFQVMYSAVDMIIVGKYVGDAGLSAVSQGSQLLNFATMLSMGFCSGGQVLISQLIGANRRKELNKVIGTLFTSVVLLGVAFSVIFVVLRETFLTLLRVPSESFAMAGDYLVICGAGLIFTFGYNMVSALLRGMGDARHPFIFITAASLMNLVLDLLFTGYLGWGVAGAAAATIVGQGASLIASMIFLFRHREDFYFNFKKDSWTLSREYLKPILQQGVPMAINSSAIHISMIYVHTLVNQVGVAASATFGVGIKLDDICTKVSIGIRHAATPMIAQNYAAGNLKRVKSIVHWSWGYACIFHGLFVLGYLCFGRQLFALFTKDGETAVLELAPVFISAIIWTFIPLAFMRGCTAFAQGIGNARLSMIFGFLDAVFCRIGLSYLFGIGLNYGFYGFVLGYGLAPFGAAIPGMIYFLSGIWKNRASLVSQLDTAEK